MNNLLKQGTSEDVADHQAALQFVPYPNLLLFIIAWIATLFALVSGALLLLYDMLPLHLSWLAHAPISAAPLLLIGAASLIFQVLTRPKPLDLLRALLVSAAFIFWGIDQLLPSGWVATTLGDVVIVLYVIDLGWMMMDGLRKRNRENGKEYV